MTITIPSEIEQSILTKAITANRAEEKLLDLYGEGRLRGTVHTCIGQEFVGATLTEHLIDGDAMFSNHRCHGHYLARTDDVRGLFHEIFGLRSGVCNGYGGSQHLYNNQFYSNGIQGGITPVAMGIALGKKLSNTNNISVVFVGDGTLGEGVLYETLNIAAKWQLPLLVVLENNGFSQSTAQQETLSGSIEERFTCFGIKAFKGDTWDWQSLYQTAGAAAEHVRNGCQPALLHVETFRLKAHSKGDDDRPKDFVAGYLAKDPIHKILSQPTTAQEQIIAAVDAKINAAIPGEQDWQPAEAAAYPAPLPEADFVPLDLSGNQGRLIKAINQAFHEIMQQNPQVVFYGEDIQDPYGGAFKVSKGLSTAFPDRVRNTPISEAAIVGMGTGLALEGYRPFIEIMFGDFATLAFDQIINHAAKFEAMYAGQVRVDTVIRTPMGGRRGYGPTHSQSVENHFMGIPGLKIVAINHIQPVAEIYHKLAAGGHGPVLLVENKILYTELACNKLPTGFTAETSVEDFPVTLVVPQTADIDVTLVGYGGMSPYLLDILTELFTEHDIAAQIFCPTQIYPLDLSRYRDRLSRAPHVVVVEEGQSFAGFGAEVIAQLAALNRPCRFLRVAPPAGIIPASYDLEQQTLPSSKAIIDAIVGRVHEH